jgi:hypothetical protein
MVIGCFAARATQAWLVTLFESGCDWRGLLAGCSAITEFMGEFPFSSVFDFLRTGSR